MTTTDLLKFAQFITDANGNKKAVVLDLPVWEEIVTALKKLDILETIKEPGGKEISLQNQQALALLQTWTSEPSDKDSAWWDEFEQELRDSRTTFRQEVDFD